MAKEKKATAAKQLPSHHGGIPEPEDLDPTPMEMPLGSCKPTPLNELIARAVHAQLQAEKNAEQETWDEANDFEPDEPEDTLDFSPYELTEVEEEIPQADFEEQNRILQENPELEPDQQEAESGDGPTASPGS